MNDAFFNEIIQYHTDKIEKYGANLQGLDWNSEEAQHVRFAQLTKIVREDEGQPFSICDYGCGLGDYEDYLNKRVQKHDYYGYDINEKMVEAAKARHPGLSFTTGNQLEADFDYLVASGIFNIRQSASDADWTEYILKTLQMFHKHTRKGFAFNCLTKYSDQDHMRDYLYYADPLVLFDYCKRNFSRNVALLHDYELYDFTILVQKNGK